MKKTRLTKEQQRAARIAAIDELGALDAELAAIKPKQARAKVLRSVVSSWAQEDGLKVDEGAVYDGEAYSVQLSQREMERAISDMKQVYSLLGKDLFLSLCKITLKDLEANLTPMQLASILTSERTGPRSVVAMQRAAAAAA